jgi:hypothetical protein
MRRTVVLLSLVLSFVLPLAIPAAQASEPGTVQAQVSSCKHRRAKKPQRAESKAKKKDKDGKKPYGFEL